jgi:hypothetical protein
MISATLSRFGTCLILKAHRRRKTKKLVATRLARTTRAMVILCCACRSCLVGRDLRGDSVGKWNEGVGLVTGTWRAVVAVRNLGRVCVGVGVRVLCKEATAGLVVRGGAAMDDDKPEATRRMTAASAGKKRIDKEEDGYGLMSRRRSHK